LLDAKMREVRGGNRMAALDRVAVLAALNLAHEVQQLRDENERRDRELARTLGDLNRRLDGLLEPTRDFWRNAMREMLRIASRH